MSARSAQENVSFDLRAMCPEFEVRASGIGPDAVFIYMALSSNPSFSRAGRADTQTVWEPYRSCTDTLPLDYDRCVKEKIRKKSGRSSVVLRTLPVLQWASIADIMGSSFMKTGLSGSMSAFRKAAPTSIVMTCLLSCAAIVAQVKTDAVATVGEAVSSFVYILSLRDKFSI